MTESLHAEAKKHILKLYLSNFYKRAVKTVRLQILIKNDNLYVPSYKNKKIA